MAGSETTASGLGFCLREMVLHPLVYQRMREEVDRVLGRTLPLDQVTLEQLDGLVYVNQVWREALRCWPIVPGSIRQNPEPLQLDGMTIPAGSAIELNICGTCRQQTMTF